MASWIIQPAYRLGRDRLGDSAGSGGGNRPRELASAGQVAALKRVEVEDGDVVVNVGGIRKDIVDVIHLPHEGVTKPIRANAELDRRIVAHWVVGRVEA